MQCHSLYLYTQGISYKKIVFYNYLYYSSEISMGGIKNCLINKMTILNKMIIVSLQKLS